MNVNPLSAEELEELANDSVTLSYQITLHMFGRTVEFKAIFSDLAFQYFSFFVSVFCHAFSVYISIKLIINSLTSHI